MRQIIPWLKLAVLLAGPSACSMAKPRTAGADAPADQNWRVLQTGTASWYGGCWNHRLTANGERFDQNSMTAAHKSLPFNSKVRVTNLSNGQCCVVRINNRGPFVRGRVIDLSVAAAKQIGSYAPGLVPVKLEVVK